MSVAATMSYQGGTDHMGAVAPAGQELGGQQDVRSGAGRTPPSPRPPPLCRRPRRPADQATASEPPGAKRPLATWAGHPAGGELALDIAHPDADNHDHDAASPSIPSLLGAVEQR